MEDGLVMKERIRIRFPQSQRSASTSKIRRSMRAHWRRRRRRSAAQGASSEDDSPMVTGAPKGPQAHRAGQELDSAKTGRLEGLADLLKRADEVNRFAQDRASWIYQVRSGVAETIGLRRGDLLKDPS